MISQHSKVRAENLVYRFDFVAQITHSFYQLPCSLLAAIMVGFMSANFVLHGSALLLLVMAGSGLGLIWHQEATSDKGPSAKASRGWTARRQTILAIGLSLLSLLTVLAFPAQAQFFGGAETWMQTNFGAATGDAIPLVFNVLRGLFLLYVGISLVRVINGARQDEDWQTIARTPLIIIIAVTAGDILTTLITG
ncbi:hypothetical protein XM38_013370 [Halomicronema hongdechloris C2206]|uniref:Uncharacterized protein n=1 Tax=Halomicronema hongdechloris C2206 TaxID=1641165 RepID=A0A1Z3HJA8_9CYAN|nr:hypothetical protein [Halomicronema hongdechloris]ASC70399.1 hypothetical protein XM38_013370 [Halomicronema hongdechloris C2206]